MTRYLRWIALAVAIAVLGVFIAAQQQSVDVSYKQAPTTPSYVEGSAEELSDATVPTVAEMTAMVRDQAVVRLPGAVARWDEARVRAAIGSAGTRILVAPPGLDEAERDRVRAVENATIRVIGTEITGDIYQASGSRLAEWQRQFATGDVTAALVSLIGALRKDDSLEYAVTELPRREPSADELAAVVSGLRRTGMVGVPQPPASAATAFPGVRPMLVALPRQALGGPMVRYGPALARTFPGTPIVVMYGDWIEYDGPDRDAFAELAAASFYGQFKDRLSRYAYPQAGVLGSYLGRVTDIRYAGLFDRPLPYQPFDPLRVALPALPWIFVACVLAFFALSMSSLLRPPRRLPSTGVRARLAGLAALAVEMSALTGSAALTRGLTGLNAAREALEKQLPDRHVHALLTRAEADLDEAARQMPFRGYRPADYLRERLG